MVWNSAAARVAPLSAAVTPLAAKEARRADTLAILADRACEAAATSAEAGGMPGLAQPVQPRVLNLAHCPGRDVPPGAVCIGDHWYRAGYRLPRSKWRNPFKIDKPAKQRDGTRAEVIAKYRAWICDQPDLMAALPELCQRDLACWCAPEACHGDVLLELANRAGC